jgi:hypothetical protein
LFNTGSRDDLTTIDDEIETGTTKNILLGCIYRPSGREIGNFNTKLLSIFDAIKNENKIVYHMGDYNLELIKHSTHPPTNEFIDLNFAHSFFPTISKPTRITSTSATLIDNIFTNHLDLSNKFSGIIPADISDNFPIFHLSLLKSISSPPSVSMKSDYSAKNIQTFNVSITNTDWATLYSSVNAQEAYTFLHERVTKVIKDVFPLTEFKSSYKTKLNWLTPGMKNSIKTKHK